MKNILISTFILASTLLSACGSNQNFALAVSTTADYENQIVPDTALTDDTQVSDIPSADPQSVNITVGDKVYQVVLYDNAATRELAERMPMELEMEELHGNEKFYYLPDSLPADTEHIGNIRAGDIMLYGSDCLVLFYEDFPTTFSYTRIGYLAEASGLSDALGSGSVTVSFRKAE